MTRTGLLVVLALAVAMGVIFAAFPNLDLQVTGLFYEPRGRGFLLAFDLPYRFGLPLAVFAALIAGTLADVVAERAAPKSASDATRSSR